MSLDGRVALVTGGSRGIGRAIALHLGRLGAVVAVNYRNQREYAAEAAAQIKSAGGQAYPVQADLTEPAQIESMMHTIGQRLGPPDILVNNAGLLIRGDLEDFNLPDMETMRGTNVDGLILVTRAVTGGMKKRGWGRIVNLTSIAAHGTAMKGTTFYAATKAAVTLLTRRFAMDLGPHGVTVNAVAPGFILTDMVKEGRSAE
ncbi:MAG: SDR family NAD(P)-dependent oxidoreductase, partial [Bryobacteraceae bacterium]